MSPLKIIPTLFLYPALSITKTIAGLLKKSIKPNDRHRERSEANQIELALRLDRRAALAMTIVGIFDFFNRPHPSNLTLAILV